MANEAPKLETVIMTGPVETSPRHRVHRVNCTGVTKPAPGILDVQFGWADGEKVTVLTTIRVDKEHVASLVDHLQTEL